MARDGPSAGCGRASCGRGLDVDVVGLERLRVDKPSEELLHRDDEALHTQQTQHPVGWLRGRDEGSEGRTPGRVGPKGVELRADR